MAVRVSVVPRDRGADWEPTFADPAQHHERLLDCESPPGRRRRFTSPSTVSTECVSLSLHCKVEKS